MPIVRQHLTQGCRHVHLSRRNAHESAAPELSKCTSSLMGLKACMATKFHADQEKVMTAAALRTTPVARARQGLIQQAVKLRRLEHA